MYLAFLDTVCVTVLCCSVVHRLLAAHYPHHCLVADWLDEETVDCIPKETLLFLPGVSCSEESLQSGVFFPAYILCSTNSLV